MSQATEVGYDCILHPSFRLRFLMKGEMLVAVGVNDAAITEDSPRFEWSELRSQLAAAGVLSEAELERIGLKLRMERVAFATTSSR